MLLLRLRSRGNEYVGYSAGNAAVPVYVLCRLWKRTACCTPWDAFDGQRSAMSFWLINEFTSNFNFLTLTPSPSNA